MELIYECLKLHVIDDSGPDSMCIIYDRAHGICATLTDPEVRLMPLFAHWQFYVRHVTNNLKTTVRNEKV